MSYHRESCAKLWGRYDDPPAKCNCGLDEWVGRLSTRARREATRGHFLDTTEGRYLIARAVEQAEADRDHDL